jgi:hypothetical protein
MASRLVLSLLLASSAAALDEQRLRGARSSDLERRDGGRHTSFAPYWIGEPTASPTLWPTVGPTPGPTAEPTGQPTEVCATPAGSSWNETKGECVCPKGEEVINDQCDPTCHPAATLIQTPAGATQIDELKVGDTVMGLDGPTTVISIIHEVEDLNAKYEKIITAAGSVTLAYHHMLMVNGEMAGAASAKVGDVLLTPTGPEEITALEDVTESGAYHIYVNATSGYFAADPGAATFFASSNVLTEEAGAVDHEKLNLGAWNITLEDLQWSLWNRAKECYGKGHYLPSIDDVGWEGVYFTPCALFPSLP